MKTEFMKIFDFWKLEYENVDPEALHEITEKTNLVTFIIIVIIAAVFLYFVVYLIYIHITTAKPKRDTSRYNNYESAAATITEIEKVAYYVEQYETKRKDADIKDFLHSESVLFKPTKSNHDISGLLNLTEEKTIPDLDKPSAKPTVKKEVEKFRYKVKYEFKDKSGRLYWGEFFVYQESENIKIGKNVDVKYNPNNPMVNFSSYSVPIGEIK